MADLRVINQPLNQPTLNPRVLSAPQNTPPTLKVSPTPPNLPSQPLQVQKAPANQPQITSVGTATDQKPYSQLKSSVGNLSPDQKMQLANVLQRGMERGLTDEQMKQVAQAFIDQQTPVAPTPEPEADRSKGFFGRLGDDLKQRYKNLQESSELVDKGEQGNASFGLQLAGQIAGGVGDVITEGLTSGFRTVAPESVQQGVAAAGEAIGQDKTVQAIFNKYNQFKEANPSAAKNLEAVGNIATILPVGKGAGIATGALERIAPKTVARIAESSLFKLGEKSAIQATEDAVESALKITRPALTTAERQAAIAAGRGEFEQGAIRIAASAKDRAIAESVANVVKDGANQLDNIAAVRQEIARVGTEVGDELARNDGIFNRSQLQSTLNKAKEASRVVFGSDKTLENAYDAVVDEMMRIADQYPKTLSNLWKARSEFDDVIESKFKNAFGEAGDNVRRNAIRDVRRAVNDYIANRLPAGNTYKPQLRRLSNMYEAVDRMALSAAKVVDQTRLQRVISALGKNPAITALAAVGLPSTIMAILGSPIALSILVSGGAYYVGKKLVTGKMLRNALNKVLSNKKAILQITERQAIKEMIDSIPVDTDPEAEQFMEEPE